MGRFAVAILLGLFASWSDAYRLQRLQPRVMQATGVKQVEEAAAENEDEEPEDLEEEFSTGSTPDLGQVQKPEEASVTGGFEDSEIATLNCILRQAGHITKDVEHKAFDSAHTYADLIPSITDTTALLHNATNGVVASQVIRDHAETLLDAIEIVSKALHAEELEELGCLANKDLLLRLGGDDSDPEEECTDKCCVEGDMVAPGCDEQQTSLLQQAAQNGTRWAGKLWLTPSGKAKTINYCFASDIHERSKRAFLTAVEQYESAVPCLRFKEVAHKKGTSNDKFRDLACAKSPAIFLQSSSKRGCSSVVGMTSTTWLQLNPRRCTGIGIAVHELGHALGMAHEQAREDRDKYVKILWDNIKSKYKRQFKINRGGDTEIKYDYSSIMHYGETDFGKKENGRKLKTIERKKGHGAIGNRMGMTGLDVNQVARMYGCLSASANAPVCSAPGQNDQCSTKKCVCPNRKNGKRGLMFAKENLSPQGKSCWACVPVEK